MEARASCVEGEEVDGSDWFPSLWPCFGRLLLDWRPSAVTAVAVVAIH